MGILDCGVERIYDEDFESQRIFLTHIAENIRHMPVEEFYKRRMFFVPNDEYMVHFFGTEILSKKYDMYYDSKMCRYYKRLAMPIQNFNGEISAFCGYDDGSEYGGENFIKYLYPGYSSLHKDRFLYIGRDEYVKAVQEDYIMLVDGMFDQVRLESFNFNAASIMSSNYTKYHQEYISVIKHKIVVPDNDEAGLKLARKIRESYPDAVIMYQTECKDIDQYLQKPENVKRFFQAFEYLKKTGFMFDINLNRFDGKSFTVIK